MSGFIIGEIITSPSSYGGVESWDSIGYSLIRTCYGACSSHRVVCSSCLIKFLFINFCRQKPHWVPGSNTLENDTGCPTPRVYKYSRDFFFFYVIYDNVLVTWCTIYMFDILYDIRICVVDVFNRRRANYDHFFFFDLRNVLVTRWLLPRDKCIFHVLHTL